MRFYEDDRKEKVPLLIRLMPLSLLTKFCDFGWKIEKFIWKFQKPMEPYNGDTKFYFDLYPEE